MKTMMVFIASVITLVAGLWLKLGFLIVTSLATAVLCALLGLRSLATPTFYCFHCGKRWKKTEVHIESNVCAGLPKWICPGCKVGHVLI